MKAAVIDEATNEVVNIIELEPDAKWEAPAGHRVKIIKTETVSIGDLQVDQVFEAAVTEE